MKRLYAAIVLTLTAVMLTPSAGEAHMLSREEKIKLVQQSFAGPTAAPRLDAPLAGLCGEIAALQEMNEAYWIGMGHNGTDRPGAPLWNAAGINGLAAPDIMARMKTATKARIASIFEKNLDERAKLGYCLYPTKWGTRHRLVLQSADSVYVAYHEIHHLVGGDTLDHTDLDVIRWKRNRDIQNSWRFLNMRKAMAPYAEQATYEARIAAVKEEAKLYNVKLF